MEDSSPLRRGRPSTHTVFGPAQTINSADYLFVEALNEVRKLNDPKCVNIFSGKLYSFEMTIELIPVFRRITKPVHRPKL